MVTRFSGGCSTHGKTFYDSRMRECMYQNNALRHESRGAGKIVIAGLENIANEIGCSKKTLYKWIRHRRFPAFKMDGVWRAMPKDIEEWFDSMRHRGPIGRS